ncbi:sugar phosphate isomerase/epimerase family protein [Naasia aerilata]|uniref:Sugar phosphate isomerase n=1 Tax=Naasia aerilata TaxID=1162966 RepID=A0ABN6XPD8_9MICO|nr:sugar phosphate isomerase [Naasia aerilata]
MIGLGSYAFFWRQSDRVPEPMSLAAVLEETRALGVGLFQICDWAPLLTLSDTELRDAATRARELGIRIELGTKGVGAEHLARFLRLAGVFDARLVRSMVFSPDHRPTLEQAARLLTAAMRDYEAAGVTLALETYEQLPTPDLIRLIERVGSESLGICLDPANTVAGLELPADVVERCAPLTKNVHAKDFAFARQDGWVGFTYSGVPLGEDSTTTRTCCAPSTRTGAASIRSSSTGCPGRATRPPQRPSKPTGPEPHWNT